MTPENGQRGVFNELNYRTEEEDHHGDHGEDETRYVCSRGDLLQQCTNDVQRT